MTDGKTIILFVRALTGSMDGYELPTVWVTIYLVVRTVFLFYKRLTGKKNRTGGKEKMNSILLENELNSNPYPGRGLSLANRQTGNMP